ncbi:hypothetical protein B0H21DRAFT_728295 [Amylocystis lapponica]|nr:hypothetical protein B0H21DRAFT_728295 [Amylocystis lapponica]
MRERSVGKPWTAEEDNLLIQAVAVHGEVDNWKTVALSIPGRTNKACRKRWLHSLSPSIKKSAWTTEEDQLLLSLYALHPTKWSVIARHIPGRTDDACSKRYREALDPSLRREEWTPDEDTLLMEAYGRLGGKWGQVGQELKRSGLGCRNRWRMLERRKASAAREDPSNGVRSGIHDVLRPPEAVPVPWSSLPMTGVAQFWDPSIPPYVSAPQDLPNGPSVTLDAHPSTFVPHGYTVTSAAIDARDHVRPEQHAPFQYTSSSLSRALSPPQISASASPHDYYVTHYSPNHEQLTMDNIMSMPAGDTTEFNPENQDFMHSDDFDLELRGLHEPSTGPLDTRICEVSPVDIRGDVITTPLALSGDPLSQTASPSTPASLLQGSHSTSAGPPAAASTSHYRTPAEKAHKPAPCKRTDSGKPPRLSSNLPATSDSAVLAYVCGHEKCWPPDADASDHRFATSKELSDHSKREHPNDLGDKPFRCGLPWCSKSWKSINGLQYHLQMSKTHFQQALSALPVALEDGADPDLGTKAKSRKMHPCPRPNCRNQYKQLSGLRYHMTHGHPPDLPVQLDVVPPALARKMAEKAQAKGTSAE